MTTILPIVTPEQPSRPSTPGSEQAAGKSQKRADFEQAYKKESAREAAPPPKAVTSDKEKSAKDAVVETKKPPQETAEDTPDSTPDSTPEETPEVALIVPTETVKPEVANAPVEAEVPEDQTLAKIAPAKADPLSSAQPQQADDAPELAKDIPPRDRQTVTTAAPAKAVAAPVEAAAAPIVETKAPTQASTSETTALPRDLKPSVEKFNEPSQLTAPTVVKDSTQTQSVSDQSTTSTTRAQLEIIQAGQVEHVNRRAARLESDTFTATDPETLDATLNGQKSQTGSQNSLSVHDPVQIAINARARADGAISDQDYKRLTESEGQTSDEIDAIIQKEHRETQAAARAQTVAASSRADLPTQVASQLSAAVQKKGSGQYEVALDPPELGRVRMSLEAKDGGMAIAIQSERPETMDLIRRHIDQLEKQFLELGYTNLSFSFGGDNPKGEDSPVSASAGDEIAPDLALSAEPPAAAQRLRTDGIDIRL